MKIINKDVIKALPEIQDNSIDLIILDPPYMKGFTKYFFDFKKKLKSNGQMLWFVQPIELYDLPEKPKQILIWKEPYSPKPIKKKYREFLDIIAWYAYENYTFNKLLWNLMNSVFEDVVIGYERKHKWEKPKTLIEKLILIHTKKSDIVFDPFCGFGNIPFVCKIFNRRFIGIDIDSECIKIAQEFIAKGEVSYIGTDMTKRRLNETIGNLF